MTNTSSRNPSRGPEFTAALPAVLFVTLVFFVNYTNRAILGPLLIHMENSLGLDHVQATSFLLFLSTGFSAGVLCSGIATSKVRPRSIVALSAIVSGCMLILLSRASSIFEVRFLLSCIGFASGFYLTAALSTMTGLVKQEDWSRAMGVHELSPAVSFIIAPLVAEGAARLWGWQGAVAAMGTFSLCTGMLFLFFGKGGTEKTERPSASGVFSAFKSSALWLFIWLFAIAVAGEFAPFSVLSLSLTVEQGLDSETASRLLSFSRLLSPAAALAGGWAVTRIGSARTILFFLAAQGVALLAMALPITFLGKGFIFFAMTCQASATPFAFPALFTFFARSFPHGQQPVILSLSLPIASYIGTGLFPLLLGACGEFASFAHGYFAFGVISLASMPFLKAFRTKES